jgi:hypothetical protein
MEILKIPARALPHNFRQLAGKADSRRWDLFRIVLRGQSQLLPICRPPVTDLAGSMRRVTNSLTPQALDSTIVLHFAAGQCRLTLLSMD